MTCSISPGIQYESALSEMQSIPEMTAPARFQAAALENSSP